MTGQTHRAVIEFGVPPRMDVVASGGREFCTEALRKWLREHPLTPYSDDDLNSGGMAYVLVVESRLEAPTPRQRLIEHLTHPSGHRLSDAEAEGLVDAAAADRTRSFIDWFNSYYARIKNHNPGVYYPVLEDIRIQVIQLTLGRVIPGPLEARRCEAKKPGGGGDVKCDLPVGHEGKHEKDRYDPEATFYRWV